MDKTLNLRLFRKRNGLTQNAVAEYLGVSKVFISYVESGRSALPEDKFQQIINNDRGWVVEDSFLVDTTLTAPTKRVPDFYENDLFRVRLIPFEARGGMIGDFVDGVMDYDCEMVVSPIKGVDFAMTVTGESMAPSFNPGDRILIKRVDPNIFLEWGKTYVLDTPNGAVIKQIRKTDDPGLVECVSLNPDYQPFTVSVGDVRGWYRVLMVMSMR